MTSCPDVGIRRCCRMGAVHVLVRPGLVRRDCVCRRADSIITTMCICCGIQPMLNNIWYAVCCIGQEASLSDCPKHVIAATCGHSSTEGLSSHAASLVNAVGEVDRFRSGLPGQLLCRCPSGDNTNVTTRQDVRKMTTCNMPYYVNTTGRPNIVCRVGQRCAV